MLAGDTTEAGCNMADLDLLEGERRELRRLLDQIEDRRDLEDMRDLYTQRLHRYSNDLAATDGLRLVSAKLSRLPYGPPVVTTSS